MRDRSGEVTRLSVLGWGVVRGNSDSLLCEGSADTRVCRFDALGEVGHDIGEHTLVCQVQEHLVQVSLVVEVGLGPGAIVPAPGRW